MGRVPLLGGAYTTRSLIADAQKCINLYPERNPQTSPVPMTYYPTPGLRKKASAPNGGNWRGLYCASNGTLFGVAGNVLYQIGSGGTCNFVGTLSSVAGRVRMQDNGEFLIAVDGTKFGYKINLRTFAFTTISEDTVGLPFQGSRSIDFVDTFLLFVGPTGEFYSTLSNVVEFDPTWVERKVGDPDPAQAVAVVQRNIWLLGSQTSELWVNSGGRGGSFPFERQPQAYIEWGIASVDSLAKLRNALYWVSKDAIGRGVIVRGAEYSAQRISTPALEYALQNYPTVEDAIGWTYQQDGHDFYMVTFPSGMATWCFDEATGEWHQRAFRQESGQLVQHRAGAIAAAYNFIWVGDAISGDLYVFDLNYFLDGLAPIVRIRSFPHLIPNGKRIYYNEFRADVQVGAQVTGVNTSINLRWSNDRGYTWGQPVSQPLSNSGQYYRIPIWNRLGYARDRVFELSWSAPMAVALNGAWVDSPDLEEPDGS